MRTVLLSAVAAIALTASAMAQGNQGAGGGGGGQQPMMNQGGGNAGGGSSVGGAAPRQGGAEMQGGAGTNMPRNNNSAQGQMDQPSNNANSTEKNAAQGQQNQGNMPGQKNAQDQRNQPDQKNAQGDKNRPNAAGSSGDRTRININTTQQKTVIKNNIARSNVVFPAGISISVGTVLPSTIAFQPVPAAIVAELPELQPYYYVVSNGQIVFVDPATYEIVYVMPL